MTRKTKTDKKVKEEKMYIDIAPKYRGVDKTPSIFNPSFLKKNSISSLFETSELDGFIQANTVCDILKTTLNLNKKKYSIVKNNIFIDSLLILKEYRGTTPVFDVIRIDSDLSNKLVSDLYSPFAKATCFIESKKYKVEYLDDVNFYRFSHEQFHKLYLKETIYASLDELTGAFRWKSIKSV